MSNIQVFNYNSNEVRTIIKDGEPWFVAKDVCEILEISKYRDAITKLDDDERRPVKVDTLQGEQTMAAISESGLYTLIMRSSKPEAKQFRRWVTGTVLPSIRKTGFYVAPQTQENGPLGYVSKGMMSSAKKIFEHAFDCKSEKDFKVALALDRIYKDFTGKSALETAGIALKKETEIINRKIPIADDMEVDCTINAGTHYSWEENLLEDYFSE